MKVPLTYGFYKAPSLMAGAQRCLNLFGEKNQGDAPYPYTYYYTPGLVELAQGPVGEWRGLYFASNGELFGVLNNRVYYISPSWGLTFLGALSTNNGPVSFADNRLSIILVDGSERGYVIDPATHSYQRIVADGFYGANRVRYIDTFFVFNRPGTNQFYSSLSTVTPAMLTGGPVILGSITAGSGYSTGLHQNVEMTGGTGEGVVADITVAAGAVTTVAITIGGENYRVGDVLTASGAALGGGVTAGTITAPGAGYVSAVYPNVPLTGGNGSGAIATITVAGGVVTGVTITSAGQGYAAAEILSASPSSLGGVGSGFVWTVSTISTAGTGFAYTLTEVGSSSFDALWIAGKSGESDGIATLDVIHRNIWLFGTQKSSEIWYNVGAPDFPFARNPGIFIEHGCAAPNSVAQTDLTMFWLGLNEEGTLLAFAGVNYQAKIVSTSAVQVAWQAYERYDDAIGWVEQYQGHSFWVVTFPTADKTWAYDLKEDLWHERAWVDDFGTEHRIRGNCMAYAYGRIVYGDWQDGKLYQVSQTAYTDAGQRIVRRRGFPHLVADGDLVTYQRLEANIEPGNAPELLTEDAPLVSLRWSDTRGQSWGNPITAPVGSGGQYNTYATFWQLGSARDRVFELFWDFPYKSSLQGAWIMAAKAGT